MNRHAVAVVTDSNSGLLPADALQAGVTVLPMPVLIDGHEFLENITITRDQFFNKLKEGCDVHTSQPSPKSLCTCWENVLSHADTLVYIPMSAALSGSLQTARSLAEEYDGRIFVVDNHRISCTQRMSVLEAAELARQGFSACEIKRILEQHASDASIYIAVDTLDYLKKGGRISAAGAALSTVLNIRPVLEIDGGKLEPYAKIRGIKQAQHCLLDAICTDMDRRFQGSPVSIRCAGTCSEENAEIWRRAVQEHFGLSCVGYDPLSLSISCHIGAGSYAVVCMKHLPMLHADFYTSLL